MTFIPQKGRVYLIVYLRTALFIIHTLDATLLRSVTFIKKKNSTPFLVTYKSSSFIHCSVIRINNIYSFIRALHIFFDTNTLYACYKRIMCTGEYFLYNVFLIVFMYEMC